MQNFNSTTIREELKKNTEVSSLTFGASMRPMLRQQRDVVVIKRPDLPFKKGDVVLFQNGKNRYLLHRVLSVNDGIIITRGDNNCFTEKVPETQIVGVLKEFYRDGKYVNCETSKGYKLYVFYIEHSYALRYFWKRIIRPVLSKIKRAITK